MTGNHIRGPQHVQNVENMENAENGLDPEDIGPIVDSHRLETSEPVPEGDLLDQLTPLDPAQASAQASDVADPRSYEPATPVDEADWLEQQHPALSGDDDEEDYPPDQDKPD